ncbi:MAG TPA: trigger factor [Anaerolineae bacterium]|nr:trigger factor [Anaerolineae bacterium]
MKISQERLPNAQIALNIEPDEQQVEQAMRKAAAKVAQRYNIPGFRKGKAPYSAVVRAFGKEALYEQAAEDMGDQVYKQALEETGLKPIGPGVLEDVTFDPLTYRLVLPMPPEVDLGDYRSVRVERAAVEISDEDIEAELLKMQEQQAEWLPLEEDGAAHGDLLTMQISGKSGDDEIIEDDAFELILEPESEDFPPGFDQQFLGVKAGDHVAFDVTYPDEWPSDRAGAEAHFEAEIISVTRHNLPELDDDFAALVGDFDTLDALKASIRQGMLDQRQEEADAEYANAVLQKMIEGAVAIEYPPVLVDDAVEHMMQEQEQNMRRSGLPLSEFLRLTGQTEADFRQLLRGRAEAGLRTDLVLDKLVEIESLQATEAEIDERVETLLADATEDSSGLREFLEMPSGRHALSHDIERRKAVQRMIAIGDGTAPELAAAPADAGATEPELEAAKTEEAEAEAQGLEIPG